MEGYLYKKQKKGLQGLHIWHRRFFTFKDDVLSYWDEQPDLSNPSSPRAIIQLSSISEVRWFKLKKGGTRFDLAVDSAVPDEDDDSAPAAKRVISLRAETRDEAREWVNLLASRISGRVARNTMRGRSKHPARAALASVLPDMVLGAAAVPAVAVSSAAVVASSGASGSSSPQSESKLSVVSMVATVPASDHPRSISPAILARGGARRQMVAADSDLSTPDLYRIQVKANSLLDNLASSRRHKMFSLEKFVHKNETERKAEELMRMQRSFFLVNSIKSQMTATKRLLSAARSSQDSGASTEVEEKHSEHSNTSNEDSGSLLAPPTPALQVAADEEHSSGSGSHQGNVTVADRRRKAKTRLRMLSSGGGFLIHRPSGSGSGGPGPVASGGDVATATMAETMAAESSALPPSLQIVLADVEGQLRSADGIEMRNCVCNYKLYKGCFSGLDFVLWMLTHRHAINGREACRVGTQLLNDKVIRPVSASAAGDALCAMEADPSAVYRLSTPAEREFDDARGFANIAPMVAVLHLMRDPRKGVRLKTIQKGFKSFHRRFTVRDAKDWLLSHKYAGKEEEAGLYLAVFLKKGVVWSTSGGIDEKREEDGGGSGGGGGGGGGGGMEPVSDETMLQFNKDLPPYMEEAKLLKLVTLPQFRDFVNSIRSDKQLLEMMLDEHVRQQQQTQVSVALEPSRSGTSPRGGGRRKRGLVNKFSASATEMAPAGPLGLGQSSGMSVSQTKPPLSILVSFGSNLSVGSSGDDGPEPTPASASATSIATGQTAAVAAGLQMETKDTEDSDDKITDEDIVRITRRGSTATDGSDGNGGGASGVEDKSDPPSAASLLSFVRNESGSRESSKTGDGSGGGGADARVKSRLEDPRVLTSLLYHYLMVISWDFTDRLREVFRSRDAEAQLWALDLLWELLKMNAARSHVCNQPIGCDDCAFAELCVFKFVDRYACGDNFSLPVKVSLLAMLIEPLWTRDKPEAFSQRVVRPGIWRAFLAAIQGAPISLRQSVLRDVNALLLSRAENALDLARYQGWQSWIVPFLNPCFDDLARSYQLSLNLLTLIHFHTMKSSTERFVGMLAETLHALRDYEIRIFSSGPHTLEKSKKPLLKCESLGTARSLMELLCMKALDAPPDDTLCNSVNGLAHVVSIFLFATPKWNHLLVEDDNRSSLDWPYLLRDSLAVKHRLHRVPTHNGFTWAADWSLAAKCLRLLEALNVPDQAAADAEAGKEESEGTRWKGFFRDALAFIEFIKEFEEIVGWDKDQMYSLCREFMTKDPAKRPEWIAKLCLKQPKQHL